MFQQVVVAARQTALGRRSTPRWGIGGSVSDEDYSRSAHSDYAFFCFSTCFFFFFVFFFFHPLSGAVPNQASPGVGGEPLLGEEGHGLIGGAEPLAGDPLVRRRHPLGWGDGQSQLGDPKSRATSRKTLSWKTQRGSRLTLNVDEGGVRNKVKS